MLWEYHQEVRIDGAQRTADRATARAERSSDNLEDILQHVERLSLACQAMWELVRDCSDLTEEDIEAKIHEIDGRDGRLDGKISPKAIDCPTCGKKASPRRPYCVMCGGPIRGPHKFG